MRDWTDQPEASGPSSETEDFSSTEFATPGWRIGTVPSPNAYPARPDPAAEAIRRTIAAERQADLGKVAPPDALDLTVPVTTPSVRDLDGPPKRRPHRRTAPPPDAEPAVAAESGAADALTPEPADTPEDAA